MDAKRLITFQLLLLLLILPGVFSETDFYEVFTENSNEIEPPSFASSDEDKAQSDEFFVLEADGVQEAVLGGGDTAARTIASEVSVSGVSYTMVVEVRDISDNTLVTDAHLEIYLENQDTGDDFTTLRYLDSSGKMELQLSQGVWSMLIRLDELSTSGKDYYSELELEVFSNGTVMVYIQPVGSLTGSVFDSSGALVPNAELMFDCSSGYGESSSELTNEYGSFSKHWLPVGSCRVSAKKNGMAGSELVTISKGELTEVEIMLSEEVSEESAFELWWILLAVIVIAVVLIIIARKGAKTRTKEKAGAPGGLTATSRMKDIISALDTQEREIMRILLREGGESIQSKIQRELSMPKSSLSRHISALETRGLIKTDRLGRVNKIKLSESFLNKK